MNDVNWNDHAGQFIVKRRAYGCLVASHCRTFLVASAFAVFGQFAQAETELGQSDTDLHLRGVASLLSQKSDPDSLAAAALIERRFDLPRSQELMERALLAAPERPDLLWLALQRCANAPGCDSASLEARMIAVAPRNGAVFLNQMDRAKAVADVAFAEQALHSFAYADRVDTYWTSLNVRLSRAIVAGSGTPLLVAMVNVVGNLSALPVPGINVLAKSCKSITEEPGGRERCRASAALLQQGDRIFLEDLGQSIALRVWPGDSAEHQVLEHRKMANRVRDRQLGRYDRLLLQPSSAEKFMTLMSENRREQDVFAAWHAYAMKQRAFPKPRHRAADTAKAVASNHF